MSGLYQTIQMIQRRVNSYTIRNHLFKVADIFRMLNDDTFTIKLEIIGRIYELVSMMRRRYNKYIAIRLIANLINQVNTYVNFSQNT